MLYGFHPNEDYSCEVALELFKLNLDDVIVSRSPPPPRDFREIMKKHDASWSFDLHSERNPTLPEESVLRSSNLGYITWGWNRDYYGIFREFFSKYYEGNEVLDYGPRDHRKGAAGSLGLALLWYRPLNQSVNLLKGLSQYLKTCSA